MKTKKNWHKIDWKKINYWQIITYIIYVIVIVFAISAILSRFSIGGVKLLTVQSGSMEPAIKMGSVVFAKSQNEYLKNNIITFRTSASLEETTTHRIVDTIEEDGVIQFQTQGDANGTPDGQLIPKDWVVGKAKFAIPYLGYPVAFVKTLPGLIILVIIPAVIIIYDEVLNIKKELAKRKKSSGVKLAKKGR